MIGLNRIQLRKSETNQAVGRRIGDERFCYYIWNADCLCIDRRAADVNGLDADGAGSKGAIAVCDVESRPFEKLERVGLGRVVDGVSGLEFCGEIGVENPSASELVEQVLPNHSLTRTCRTSQSQSS